MKVLQLALSPLREKAGKTFNLTAAAAHWSLLAVRREQPEVETILKTYFREAPETELRFFFRRVGETERRRLLDAERIALLPPPEETVRARPANPFAGLYRNWENRRTSSEEAERRVADYEKLLCEDSPQSDPAKIRSFIAYFYRGNLPELKPEEVETEPFKEPPNPLLKLLSRLVNEGNPLWSGTATELVQCLSKMDSAQVISPNWIVRTLNVQQDTLLRKYGIHYVAQRIREGKSLSLRWDGVR